MDQEPQAADDLPGGGAGGGSGALRVELLDREDRGAQRGPANRPSAPRARVEELPARGQRVVASSGKLFRDERGARGQHLASAGSAGAGPDPAGDRRTAAVGSQGRQVLQSPELRTTRCRVRERAPIQGRRDRLRGCCGGGAVSFPPSAVSLGRGAGLAFGGGSPQSPRGPPDGASKVGTPQQNPGGKKGPPGGDPRKGAPRAFLAHPRRIKF